MEAIANLRANPANLGLDLTAGRLPDAVVMKIVILAVVCYDPVDGCCLSLVCEMPLSRVAPTLHHRDLKR